MKEGTNSPFKRIERIIGLLAINTLLLILLLLGLEYALERWEPALKGDASLIARCVPLREAGLPNSSFLIKPNPHDFLISDNIVDKTYKISLDSNGFISSNIESEGAVGNVYFLGGSTTLCAMVDDSLRFPGLVSNLFANADLKVNTFNGGEKSNHTLNSINNLINKVIHTNANMVVMMHNVNDLSYMMYFGDYFSQDEDFFRRLIVTAYIPEKTNNSLINLHTSSLIFRIKKSFQALYPNVYGSLYELKQNVNNDPIAVVPNFWTIV
ncbi:MAG: hypothetical protein R2830_21650 [Saprospiraceae bacterium]|nr:hypothetical protein [Saprospiraceae bacterium]